MNRSVSRIFNNIFLVLILAFIFTKDSFAVYRVMGAGQKNCNAILMHRDVKEVKFIVVSWAQGFLSGLNLGVSVLKKALGNEIADEKLWEKIIWNCQKNPSLNLTTISQSIFTELNHSPSIKDSFISDK